MKRLVPAVALLALSIATTQATAQTTADREGFWFNIGIGVGSLGCNECVDRVTGPSGGIALGGAISRQFLLGAFSNGWVKTEDGVTLTAGTLVVGARFYPSESSGFFLLGGVGIGRIDLAVAGFGSASENGAGALFGLGWDIPLGRSTSLTPFWNGIGIATSNSDANFGQIGIGLTIH
jgi:hypothetical protein